MKNNQIWKDIKKYEGLYQISNVGNVRSLERIVKYGDRERLKKEKSMKQQSDKQGYLSVGLHKNGKNKIYKVHRLVAEAFLNNPKKLPQVNHKDENKKNNSIDNLEWCTQKYNNEYGTRTSRTQKIVYQYDKQGNFIKEWQGVREIERALNIKNSHISSCCNGRIKSIGGFIFKYNASNTN